MLASRQARYLSGWSDGLDFFTFECAAPVGYCRSRIATLHRVSTIQRFSIKRTGHDSCPSASWGLTERVRHKVLSKLTGCVCAV